MEKFVQYLKGTRKFGLAFTGLFLLMPVIYVISATYKNQFQWTVFVDVLLMATMMGTGTSLFIMTNYYLITEKLLNKLKLIDVKEIGDGNLRLVDRYTGWERKIEYVGTTNGKKIWMYHEFKKGWVSQIPYLCITVDPDLTWKTIEIKVDKYLTADIISKGVSDAQQPT